MPFTPLKVDTDRDLAPQELPIDQLIQREPLSPAETRALMERLLDRLPMADRAHLLRGYLNDQKETTVNRDNRQFALHVVGLVMLGIIVVVSLALKQREYISNAMSIIAFLLGTSGMVTKPPSPR